MKEERQLTLGDLFALAIAPALIMALVVSLVFFLVEVLYSGQYQGRLQWILFFFVFGAVLIARVSMMGEIAGRAGIYGLFLGGATWLGLVNFVEYPKGSGVADWGWLINIGLIALVWWCAHRLTWDCTHVDDGDDDEGRGVLQAAGLQAGPESMPEDPPTTPKGDEGWLERYQKHRQAAMKKRTRGVWVIYFSLAALPLFGLGQSLIPVEHEHRRRFAFWLLTVYVGSGLALLLVTTFLGLRRYLRGRRVKMPMSIAGLWLALGGGIIGVLLFGGAFLPRPRAEYPIFELVGVGSAKKKASDHDILGGQGGENEGQPGAKEENPTGKDDPNQKGKDQGEAKDKDQGNPKQGKGGKKDPKPKPDIFQDPPPANHPPWLETLLTILKWIVFGILALVVAIILLRGLLKFMANFSAWAKGILEFFQRLWAGLFGSGSAVARSQAAAEVKVPPRPFASFSNPFADGSAAGRSIHDLILYTFEALQAWALERDLGRPIDETPLEFCHRLGLEFSHLGDDLQRLAILHARAYYGPRGPLPASALAVLEACWLKLDEKTLALV